MNKKNNDTGLVIVDMQDFFLKKFEQNKVSLLIKNQVKLLRYCSKNKIPVFVLEYNKRGTTTKPLKVYLQKLKIVNIIVKNSNSGFRDTNLEELLSKLKINRIILAGINGSGCVQDTAIGALKRGLKIITSSEIIASNTIRDINLATSKKWYSMKGNYFEKIEELLYCISN
jgi:nicotinamidase-related amidase